MATRIAFAALIGIEFLSWAFFPHITSDFTWAGLIVTAGFAWGITEFLGISAIPVWVIFVNLIVDNLSSLFEMYSRIDSWDQFIHVFGGFAIALAGIELIMKALKEGHVAARRHRPFVISCTYLLVVGVGFLYEFWEYLVDKLQYGYPKSLVSAYDSVEDQLFNLAGATIVLVGYYIWQRRKLDKKP